MISLSSLYDLDGPEIPMRKVRLQTILSRYKDRKSSHLDRPGEFDFEVALDLYVRALVQKSWDWKSASSKPGEGVLWTLKRAGRDGTLPGFSKVAQKDISRKIRIHEYVVIRHLFQREPAIGHYFRRRGMVGIWGPEYTPQHNPWLEPIRCELNEILEQYRPVTGGEALKMLRNILNSGAKKSKPLDCTSKGFNNTKWFS